MLCCDRKFRQQSDHWFFQEIIFAKGLIQTSHAYADTLVVLLWYYICGAYFLLLLNFFMKNVVYDKSWHIRLYVWFDFHVNIFFFIFLYLCVLEAIWFLFWTMKDMIWKCMAYFTLMTLFFSVKMGYFWIFILEFKPLPLKKPWHVINCWTRNFK